MPAASPCGGLRDASQSGAVPTGTTSSDCSSIGLQASTAELVEFSFVIALGSSSSVG